MTASSGLRAASDARITTVLAAFDEAIEADDVAIFMDTVIGFRWAEWPNATFRSLIREIGKRMPEEDLEQLFADAKSYIQEIKAIALEHEYELKTGKPCTGADATLWLLDRASSVTKQVDGGRR